MKQAGDIHHPFSTGDTAFKGFSLRVKQFVCLLSNKVMKSCLVFPALFVEEAVSSPMCALASFSSQRTVVVWMYIGSSVLSHWSACPFCALLCQCHAVFITMALSYSWNQVLGCLQEYSYCSGLLWISQVLCASIRILRFFFYFCKELSWHYDWKCSL